MGPMVRRFLPRLLLVALVGGAFLPLGLARGQVGDVPSSPLRQNGDVPGETAGQEPREKQLEMAGNPDAAEDEPEEGLQPASGEGQQTTASLVSVKVRTADCAEGPGSETRLGMMKNSAAYSYCP